MERQTIIVLAIVMVASLVPVCEADPVQWRIENGGNGHYYEVVDMGTLDNWLTWEEAKAAAEAASCLGVPGHLATITSPEEEQFIIDNLLPPYGSWAIGGHQPVNPETAPDEGWEWITCETWGYTNWQWAEPWSPPGVDEDTLNLAHRGAPGNKIWGWQDIEYTTKDNGYIIEYPVSEPAGPVGQWLFEEGPDGTTFLDTSGNGNDGSLSGDVFWSSDAPPCESWSMYSTSHNFDAIVPDNGDILDITEDFTVAAWVKVADLLEVVAKHHDHGDYDGSWRADVFRPYVIYAPDVLYGGDDNNDVVIQMGAFGNGGTYAYSEPRSAPTDSWVHIAITYDDSSNTARFYINGEQAGVRTMNWQISDTVEPVTFGYEPHPSQHATIGDDRISSVAIYKRALSASEIEELVAVCEPEEPNIVVEPLSHDFGDVELGTSRTVIVTISNIGSGDLTVSSIALETDFAITSAPAASIVIEPNETVDVEITYTPSVVGYNLAVLKITSDDPDEPVVEIQLSAVGIEIPPHPSEQIANILVFFDTSIGDGILVGDGPGNSAEKRLNALRNMIEAAGDLIEGELFEEACQQLQDIYRRTDGQSKPPDFVQGLAVPELAEMILELMDTIGCE